MADLERYRLARDALPQVGHLVHELLSLFPALVTAGLE